jgi:hypothetical protein
MSGSVGTAVGGVNVSGWRLAQDGAGASDVTLSVSTSIALIERVAAAVSPLF